jgi:heat shock protein HslJ
MVVALMTAAACAGNRPSDEALPGELDTLPAPVVLPSAIEGLYAATVPLASGMARLVTLELRGDGGAVYRTADGGAAPVERVGRYRGRAGEILEVDLPAPLGGNRRDTLRFRVSSGALTAVRTASAEHVGDLVLRRGAGGVGRGTAAPSTLPGTAWRLTELDGRAPAAPPEGEGLTLEFAAAGEGRASGNAGCNRFSGGYTHAGPTLRLGPLASTKRACADDALNRQESAYLQALQAVTRAVVYTDRLDLYASDRLVARFRPSPR